MTELVNYLDVVNEGFLGGARGPFDIRLALVIG